jgi:hypothetical protein
VNRPFISKPDNYPNNIRDGADITAGPAYLTGPAGQEPGVVIRNGFRIRSIIPAAQAIRLANEIADAVEAAERNAA